MEKLQLGDVDIMIFFLLLSGFLFLFPVFISVVLALQLLPFVQVEYESEELKHNTIEGSASRVDDNDSKSI